MKVVKEMWSCLLLERMQPSAGSSHCCAQEIRDLCDKQKACISTLQAGWAWFRHDEVMEKLTGEEVILSDEQAQKKQKLAAKDDYKHCRKVKVTYEEVK